MSTSSKYQIMEDAVSRKSANTIDAILNVDSAYAFQLAYTKALGETVAFDGIENPRKEDLRSRKVLESLESLNILTIFWKESSFVDENDLKLLEKKKTFKNGLNCNQLAGRIAETARDTAKTIKRIENIAKSAEHFGLIKRTQGMKSRAWEIQGTELLHKLMLRFSNNASRLNQLPIELRSQLDEYGAFLSNERSGG